MNEALELERPRELSTLFGDALRAYGRHFLTFFALAAAIVIPAGLVVSGIGLEELTGPYDPSPPVAELVVTAVVGNLVVSPLINAVCIHALHAVAAGERPSPGPSLAAGFEVFAPLFLVVVMALVGIALGLLLFVVPGVYLAVRWYLAPQAVVIEEKRSTAALERSGDLVAGQWFRTFGIVVLGTILGGVPSLLLAAPFASIAESADRAVWTLVGSMLAQSLAAPFAALLSTLLYYDLRARKR